MDLKAVYNMKRYTEPLKYLLLIASIFAFFAFVFLLARQHRSPNEQTETTSPAEESSQEDSDVEVSDYFNGEYDFDTDLDEGDPFAKYCSGNEGAINTFTVCARD